jgi:hypothetical protein
LLRSGKSSLRQRKSQVENITEAVNYVLREYESMKYTLLAIPLIIALLVVGYLDKPPNRERTGI